MADNTFHIKNFDRLQHYKNRSPPWIKLYNGLLDDYDFGRLPDASKAHLIAIGLLASRHNNKLPLDAEWLGKRINATETVDLELLIKSGFVVPDQGCSNLLASCKQSATPERERETERETEKEGKKKAANAVLPDWLPKESWEGFKEMRRNSRYPLKGRSETLALNELAKLRDEGHDPAAVLDHSTMKGYRGLFPPPPAGTNGQTKPRELRYPSDSPMIDTSKITMPER